MKTKRKKFTIMKALQLLALMIMFVVSTIYENELLTVCSSLIAGYWYMLQIITDDEEDDDSGSIENIYGPNFIKIVFLFALPLTILGIVFFSLRMSDFENVINVEKLFLIFVPTGLALSLLIETFIKKRAPKIFRVPEQKLAIRLALYVGFTLFLTGYACYINKIRHNLEVLYVKTKIIKLNYLNESGLQITCSINGSMEKFESQNTELNLLKDGDNVILYVRKGCLGFDYIEAIARES